MNIILKFTAPIVAGNIFQQVYGMVDAMVVGKFVGTGALAAVGSVGTIYFLIFGSITGFTAGITVPTAQRFGAGDHKNMRRSVVSAVFLALLCILIMTSASMFFMNKMLTLLHTPEDIYQDAYVYIMIICGGIFATVSYNTLSGIIRGLGNSRTPILFLTLSTVLNILLDLLFVIVFHMGVAGAGIATVISQTVSAGLCLWYVICKMPELKLQKGDLCLTGHLLKMQAGIGLPMAFQYSITALGALVVQSSLNLLGSVTVAAFTAAGKIEQFANQVYVSLGTTMATFAAQNKGAGKIKRIREGFRAATLLAAGYSVFIGLLTAFGGKYLTGLFVTDHVAAVAGQVDIYLKCAALFYMTLAVVNIYRNGIQGMGYGILPMLSGVAELLGRTIMGILAGVYSSYFLVCLSNPAAWSFATVLLLVLYFRIMKKEEAAMQSSC